LRHDNKESVKVYSQIIAKTVNEPSDANLNFVFDEIIKKVIEFSELGKYIYLPVKTYSSGMLMRLSFSILSFIRADIIVMDEWLSVGDASFFEKANNKLKEIIDDASILVIASHSPDLIDNLCNKKITLNDGKINEKN